jgi:5-methylthioadenosine/S-adenosylhomocysteine deaminase
MNMLIKKVWLNNKLQDIYIEGNTIHSIGENLAIQADVTIDGTNKAAIPGLVNGHTHAAMTLMRGYADDMPLMPWLEQKIWPLEAKITEDDVYWGAKLACLEMIKSGTTLMYDMYHHFPGTCRAVDEMGMRGVLTHACMDFELDVKAKTFKKEVLQHFDDMHLYSNRVRFALGPHAIYSVSTKLLKWVADFSKENNIRVQTHLSETTGEVEESLKRNGKTPTQHLHELGFLNERVSLAHGIYLNEDDLKLIADHGCQIVHNPASNMKLASGARFRFADMKRLGIPVSIGTDGTSSGNNLDMLEAMKLASLLGKVAWNDPTIWNAEETFACATEVAEKLTGIKTGKLEPGYLADLCLVDLTLPEMTPNFNLISNLVYSANGHCIDTVVCDGKILMQNRHVPGEEEIVAKAAQVAQNLANR